MLPFDLHVLSIPPAFNLSHDQTLQFNISNYFLAGYLPLRSKKHCCWFEFRKSKLDLQTPSLFLDLANASTHTNYLIQIVKEHCFRRIILLDKEAEV